MVDKNSNNEVTKISQKGLPIRTTHEKLKKKWLLWKLPYNYKLKMMIYFYFLISINFPIN